MITNAEVGYIHVSFVRKITPLKMVLFVVMIAVMMFVWNAMKRTLKIYKPQINKKIRNPGNSIHKDYKK